MLPAPRVARVQAFRADGGLLGNGAGVMILPPLSDSFATPLSDAALTAWLQSVAAAVGLSETSFVQRRADGGYDLRWLTPTREVALCGHGTLAAAHAVWEEEAAAAAATATAAAAAAVVPGAAAAAAAPPPPPPPPPPPRQPLVFHTASGALTVWRGARGAPCARFPLCAAAPSSARAAATHRALAAALLPPAAARGAALWHSAATGKLLAVLDGDAAAAGALLRSLPRGDAASSRALLAVDQSALPPAERVTGVSLTARGDGGGGGGGAHGADFCSRYFSPWNGIDEDPVNGSSHTALAPLWADALQRWLPAGDELEAAELRAVQLSPEGGLLELRAVRPRSSGGGGGGGGGGGAAYVDIGGATATVAADVLRTTLGAV